MLQDHRSFRSNLLEFVERAILRNPGQGGEQRGWLFGLYLRDGEKLL